MADYSRGPDVMDPICHVFASLIIPPLYQLEFNILSGVVVLIVWTPENITLALLIDTIRHLALSGLCWARSSW